jgi:hypothetical protein
MQSGDSVAIVPRRFNAPPFVCAFVVFALQIVISGLSLLQLIRGWAWMSSGSDPLLWLILSCSQQAVNVMALLVVMLYVFLHLGRTQDRKLERHYHPNLAATIYVCISVLTMVKPCAIFVYYYIHYNGVSPVARSTGDVNAASERLSIWTNAHDELGDACTLGVVVFLATVITPSISAIRYWVNTAMQSPVVVTDTTPLINRGSRA